MITITICTSVNDVSLNTCFPTEPRPITNANLPINIARVDSHHQGTVAPCALLHAVLK